MRHALWLALVASACTASQVRPHQGVNAIVGDRSWVERFGTAPGPDASEDDRIAVHLAWVEAKLRRETPSDLEPERALRRDALLDVLAHYRHARSFPRQATGKGRLPRFVDDEGRHCAVAHLVGVSDPELVAKVQAAHEYDRVESMDVPELATWASHHGLRVSELALIQPTYDDGSGVHVPSPIEEREARRRAAAAARVPRPLEAEHVQGVVRHLIAAGRECAGERTGRWRVRAELRVERGMRVTSRVRVSDEADRRDRGLERCLVRQQRRAMRTLLASANYRFRAALRESHEVTLEIATPDEVRAALVAQRRVWHAAQSRARTLAGCMQAFPGSGPLSVPVRVAGWNGRVIVRWDDLPGGRSMPSEERTRWYCVQNVLTYGDVSPHGVRDYDLTLEIQRDGSLR